MPVHEHVDRRATRYMLQLSTILPARTFRETDGRGIWIWSDPHFGHADSVRYFDRPFIDPEHMGPGASPRVDQDGRPGRHDRLSRRRRAAGALGPTTQEASGGPGPQDTGLRQPRRQPARPSQRRRIRGGPRDAVRRRRPATADEAHAATARAERLRQCPWPHPQRPADSHETRQRELRADPVPAGRTREDPATGVRARGWQVPGRDHGRTPRQPANARRMTRRDRHRTFRLLHDPDFVAVPDSPPDHRKVRAGPSGKPHRCRLSTARQPPRHDATRREDHEVRHQVAGGANPRWTRALVGRIISTSRPRAATSRR